MGKISAFMYVFLLFFQNSQCFFPGQCIAQIGEVGKWNYSAPVTKFETLMTGTFSPWLHHRKPYVAMAIRGLASSTGQKITSSKASRT